MATRFYFNTGQAGDIALPQPLVSFAPLWDQNVPSLPTTRRISKVALGTANNAAAPYGQAVSNLGTGSTTCDILFFQGISEPLAAQTISGTVTGVASVREGNTSDNLFSQLAIYVVNSAGTLVATLWGGQSSSGTEWNSPSANNRHLTRLSSQTLTSYTCSAGDRIVIEVGARTQSTRTTVVAYMYLGDPGGGDLPSDASGNNLTINPWIEFSANLQFGNAGSFTLDASINAHRSGSFGLDAYLYAAGPVTNSLTLDSVLRVARAGTFALDAVKRQGRSGTLTLDSYLSVRHTGSFTLDAILQDNPALAVDDPFDDPETVAGTWGSRWTAIRGIEGSTAEIGRNPTKGAFIFDESNTVLDSERGGYLNRRTYTKKVVTARAKLAQVGGTSIVGETRFAVYLRHSGETSGLGFYNATYVAVELKIQAGGALALGVRTNYNTDVYGPVDLTATLGSWSVGDEFYVKGWVKGSRVKGKVWRVGDPEPRWQINQVLTVPTGAGYLGMAANTRTSWKAIEWDVRRVTAYNLDFSVDLDAVIKRTQALTLPLDAIIRATPSGSFSLDARIAAATTPGTGSFDLDAVIGERFQLSFPIAAITRAGRSGTFGLATVVQKTRLASFTADAILSTPRGGSFTLDGWKLAGRSGALSIDAIVRAERAGTYALDAVTLAPRAGSLLLDAAIVRRTVAAAPLDAVLLKGRTGSFSLSAVIGRTSERSFSADSVIKRIRSTGLALDSVIKATPAGQAQLDSVIQRTQASSFSLSAVKGLAFLEPVGGEVVIDMLEASWSMRYLGFAADLRVLEAATWIEYPLGTVVAIEEVGYTDG